MSTNIRSPQLVIHNLREQLTDAANELQKAREARDATKQKMEEAKRRFKHVAARIAE